MGGSPTLTLTLALTLILALTLALALPAGHAQGGGRGGQGGDEEADLPGHHARCAAQVTRPTRTLALTPPLLAQDQSGSPPRPFPPPLPPRPSAPRPPPDPNTHPTLPKSRRSFGGDEGADDHADLGIDLDFIALEFAPSGKLLATPDISPISLLCLTYVSPISPDISHRQAARCDRHLAAHLRAGEVRSRHGREAG